MSPHDAGTLAGATLADPSAALDLARARYPDAHDVRTFALAFLRACTLVLRCEREGAR